MAASMAKLVLPNFCRENPFSSPLQRFRIRPMALTCETKRSISTISKNKLEVDPDVDKQYEDENSFKKHPGSFYIKQVTMPVKLQNTLGKIVSKYADSVGNVTTLCDSMTNYLYSRRSPIEKRELKLRAIQYEKEFLSDIKDLALKSEEEMATIGEKIKQRVTKKLKQNTYRWESIDYNAKNAFVYLASRAVPDYAAIFQIFTEIKKRDADFKPRAFYDFGSGIGSGMWALNSVWPGERLEYYCVDISDDMHTLSRLVLQDGEENKEMSVKPVFYRQFAPAAHKNKYEMVLSAYTLMELPDKSSRVKAVMDLWKKTDKYLVLVEYGSNAGFRLIREARDAILKASEMSKHTELSQHDKEYNVTYEGHVFAPCPHDVSCPWPVEGRTPCNYEVSYAIPNWSKKYNNIKKSSTKASVRYSYVVMKKGARTEESVTWPRVIRPVSTPSKHVHCRLCCENGKLEHHILTQRLHGKTLYKCARNSKWGDLIPAKLAQASQRDSNIHADETEQHSNTLTDENLNFSDELSDKAEVVDEQMKVDDINGSFLVMGRSSDPQTDIRTRRGLTLSGKSLVKVILNNRTDSEISERHSDSDHVEPSPVPT